MKTTLIRAFVFSLVFTGLAASTAVSRASSHVSATTIAAKGGMSPVPTSACGPHDPTHCGMD